MVETSMDAYIDRGLCVIWRHVSGCPGRAVVIDAEGHPVLDVDERIDDEEIWQIVDVINQAYKDGVKNKMDEIKMSLGVA
ncbi:MAG: hypothetical protein B0D91_13340 [Oceanospirillales bacterium LUC14_002_19_P2]|nr:MAG: hypothetical protein B0D91_13340 [Oceanospirillales bacterium LUC14_002_19_P2]